MWKSRSGNHSQSAKQKIPKRVCINVTQEACQDSDSLGFSPRKIYSVDVGHGHVNKHPEMILMKATLLVKPENKEHNLPAAFLNRGSASELLRCFKKKTKKTQCLMLSIDKVEAGTKPIRITHLKARVPSHTPGPVNGNSEGKAKKATFLTSAPSGPQRWLHK